MSVPLEELRKAVKEAYKEGIEEREQQQESHSEHVCNCKDCWCDAIKRAHETMNHLCASCGLPVPDSMVDRDTFREKEQCPGCGNKSWVKKWDSYDKEKWRRKFKE